MPDPNAYRSIKVPAWVYENWKQVDLAISRKGIDAIPPDLARPRACPACRTKLETFEARYKFVRCQRCGYTQQTFGAGGTFVSGALLGLALGLLFSKLSEE